jgi:hypothetical protein
MSRVWVSSYYIGPLGVKFEYVLFIYFIKNERKFHILENFNKNFRSSNLMMQNARIKMFNSSLTNINMPMSEHFRRQWHCG